MPAKAAAPAPVAPPLPHWELTFNTEARYFAWESSRGYPTSPSMFRAAAGRAGTRLATLCPVCVSTGRPAGRRPQGRTSGALGLYVGTAGDGRHERRSLDAARHCPFRHRHLSGLGRRPALRVAQSQRADRQIPVAGECVGFARGDSDLVDIPALGEGFNVGPTVGVNIPVTSNFILTGSVGYTNRGPFDREASFSLMTGGVGVLSLDPGDVATVAAGFGYQVGALTVQGTGSYAFEGTTTYDGRPAYKSGDRYSVTGVLAYAWTRTCRPSSPPRSRISRGTRSASRLSLRSISRSCWRHSIPTATSPRSTSIRPTGSAHLRSARSPAFVYRDRNGWDPTTFQFVPAKTSWSVRRLGAIRGHAAVHHHGAR